MPTKFKVGDRVINKHLLDIMVYTKLDNEIWKKATLGIVVKNMGKGWGAVFGDGPEDKEIQYMVKFDNGAELSVKESHLVPMDAPGDILKDMLK